MSATMDCSLFSKYFSIIVRNKLEGAPVVSVEGKMYDVAEYYLDHLHTLGEVNHLAICIFLFIINGPKKFFKKLLVVFNLISIP